MKKLYTESDIGSAAVQTASGDIICFPNLRGDGTTKIYIFDNFAEFDDYVNAHKKIFNNGESIAFISSARLNSARVLLADWAGLHGQKVEEEAQSCEALTGRFLVYAWSSKVYFVKIED